jgi:hypothetical protein
MDFTGPEVYDQLEKSIREESGYAVVTLPSGSTIYRADKTGKKSPSEGVPNFFSDKLSIKPYTGGKPETISSYTTNKPLNLFVLEYSNIFKLAENSDKTIQEFVYGTYLAKGEIGGEPFLILKPTVPVVKEGKVEAYANRRFAEIVCSKGYDGWIAFPDTLEQLNINMEHYKKTGEIRLNVINPYAPEIVICKWKDTMDYKGGRKMTRKYCKKTPCRKMGFTQRASCRPWKNCYKNKK